MPSAIPPVLVPYLEQCLARPSQILVTSVLDASAHWLIVRLLLAAIHGVSHESPRQTVQPATAQKANHVVFVSILRSPALWNEIGKKINFDIAASIASKRLVYIDGLIGGLDGQAKPALASITLKSHGLRDISTSIAAAHQSLVQTSSTSAPTGTIVLDGIDFVLASQPDISQIQISQFLLSLQEQFANVILTASADAPLLHNTDAAATALEIDHGMFIRTASYQSYMIMQVRPLDTGSAKDVSGVVRISTGGQGEEDVVDGEWLYQIKGDGSARAWSRGE